jgi:hypothetical protein
VVCLRLIHVNLPEPRELLELMVRNQVVFNLTLMKRMGIEALYRSPRTTKPEPGQDLSVSAARDGDHAAQPGVGDGHHLHPDDAWLRLSGCRAGLVQSSRAVVARVDLEHVALNFSP